MAIMGLLYSYLDIRRSSHNRRGFYSAWDEAQALENGSLRLAAWETRSSSDPPVSEKHEYENVGLRVEEETRGELRPLLTSEHDR